ncbi:MAG TPA: hypothetical protein PK378_06750, partial [Bifidobacterium longum]|nr:hypothetical protein [Bifidobacterium longum]
ARPRIMESLRDIMFPFVGQNLGALSFVYRLLSETGFRITQSDDKRKGTIPLSAFLAEYRRSLDTIR